MPWTGARRTYAFVYRDRAYMGFPLARSMRKYSWSNDRTQSYALGWLYADFTVTACDLSAETVTFAYTPEKVSALLSGQHSRGRETSVSAAKPIQTMCHHKRRMIAVNYKSVAGQRISGFRFCFWPHFDRNKDSMTYPYFLNLSLINKRVKGKKKCDCKKRNRMFEWNRAE